MRVSGQVGKIALLALGIGAWSCSDAATQALVNSIALSLGLTTLTVGQTVQAAAIVRDATNNTLDGQTITWGSTNPNVASVTNAGLVTALAKGTTDISGSVAGKSASVTITVVAPSALASITIGTPPPSTAAAGAVLTPNPTVQLRDGSGNALSQSGVVVTARIATGNPALNGTTTATTDANGIATFPNLIIGGLVGSRTLEFSTSPTILAQSSAIAITPGAAAVLVLSVAPSTSGTSGDPLAVQPVVALKDAYTNPVVQAGVTIGVTASGGATLISAVTATTNASGIATFSGLGVNGSGATTLTFSSGALSQVTGAVSVVAPITSVSFDKYATTAAMLADCVTFDCVEQHSADTVGGYINTTTLDATAKPPGQTNAMMYHYRHTGDGCTSITLRRAINIAPQQEVWGEFQVRWSSNFTTNNATCPPNDHKLIFGDTEAESNYRWALYVGADGPGSHLIRAEIPMGGFPGDGPFYITNAPSAASVGAERLWDGNWHVVRLHMKASTTSSSKDGQFHVWIDGERIVNQTGFSITRNDGTTNGDRITGFSFAHNKDDGPPGVDMFLWWGRVRIFGTNPGW